ncbi:uncharacterized protein MELLADRAFT_109522 [Melampsora larici-populina 98AG31]|uniref:Endonuclease/exonuclease/phosphatase domain-containing protein n=1 Tax=Melampsora larici-populina (strain 98AG31 / pathotype 3-4-7) TaxID=747676 RepID=F4RWR5_MELLP|nr:uncharacterized protein MELLADRAFT_109522 [Melampsora larici-populina 98AG31]EGG03075.1 hypothetical protein MELLADRAFT_109522 [Melampsora larici-populina 98AG31]
MIPLHYLSILKLATYNIRYSPTNSHPILPEAPWSTRLPLILNQLNWEEPDIIGAQEVLDHQFIDLLEGLHQLGYTGIGVGRDDGKRLGEYAPIFWKSDQFELVDHHYFWLSEEPDVPGSISWDSGQTRMVTCVELKPKLNTVQVDGIFQLPGQNSLDRSIFVMNTHFDDRGSYAREQSAKLICYRAEALIKKTSKPVFLLGDLNSTPEELPYKTLTTESTGQLSFKDSRQNAKHLYGAIKATYTSFSKNPSVQGVIDVVIHPPVAIG